MGNEKEGGNEVKIDKVVPNGEVDVTSTKEVVEVRMRSGYLGHQRPRTVTMSPAKFVAAAKVTTNGAGIVYGD